jgi:hypothetical protein
LLSSQVNMFDGPWPTLNPTNTLDAAFGYASAVAAPAAN